jgi:beta-glucosidase
MKQAGAHRRISSAHHTPPSLKFPKGFLWGAAASSHQVEGHNHNSWTEWENLPGKIADGSRSGMACDHYRRFEADCDDLKRLNHTTHRLSLEWSRLEPEPGRWDGREFEHYRKVLAALGKRGIEPMVTLHHFTNPVWFERLGAFSHDESPDMFARFAAQAAQELGAPVKLWCTINEPVIYAYFGYLSGLWPPGERDFGRTVLVLRHLLSAHALAYRALHGELGRTIKVGIAKHMRIFDPWNPRHPGDRSAARLNDFMFNRAVLIALTSGRLRPPLALRRTDPALAGTLDFIGVNYYSRELVRFRPHRPGDLFSELRTKADAPHNSLGWEIYPEGLLRVLTYCQRFGLPLYVTENGIPTENDAARVQFIAGHLKEVHRAIKHGVDVRGYYYWSALDNFEWAEGYTARFGLIDVNFKTQKRTIRESGRFLADVALCNALSLSPFPEKEDTKYTKRTKGTKGKKKGKTTGEKVRKKTSRNNQA